MKKISIVFLGTIISTSAFADLASDFQKESERLNTKVFSEDKEKIEQNNQREELQKKNPVFGDVRYIYELKAQKIREKQNPKVEITEQKNIPLADVKNTSNSMPVIESVPLVPNSAPMPPQPTLRVIGNNTEKAQVNKDGTIKLPNGTLITPRNTTANLLNNPAFLTQ